jgi:hypothetical protein
MAADGADAAAVVKKAEAAAAAMPAALADNAALYLRFMGRATEKGKAWVAGEVARLQKMQAAPMSAAKATEVRRKVSVLTAFDKDHVDPVEVDEEAEAEEMGGMEGMGMEGLDGLDFGGMDPSEAGYMDDDE